LLTARLCGAKAWLHLQDFEVDLAFGMGLLKNPLLKRVVLRMERWIMRRFDSVSSISARMVERLLVKGVDPQRTGYFPNWVDIAHVKPSPLRGESYRTQLGIAKDAVVVLFSGSLGGKQGLMVIPQIAELLRDRKDIVFVICGDGVMKPALEAATTDMAKVKFLPLQPFSRLGELLSLADIHLLPQSVDAADLVLPSKLSGMMASGRPVISTCRPSTELGAVIMHCGVTVPPADPPALARAIGDLADDPTRRSNLGRAARAYAEVYFEREGVLERRFGPLEAELAGETQDAVA
jgi:colanic acid biosynthesis glycosyl transferase WcaI